MKDKDKDVMSEIDEFIAHEKKKDKKKETKKEIKEEVIKEQVEIKEEPVKKEKVKKEKKNKKDKKSNEVSDVKIEEIKSEVKEQEIDYNILNEDEEEEDIYITRSFKPIKKKKRLRRRVVNLLKIFILLGILALLLLIIGLKVRDMYISSLPINIYKEVIDTVGDKGSKFIKDLKLDNSYELSFDINTNYEGYEFIDNRLVGYSFINKDNVYQDYLYIVDDNDERIGVNTIINAEGAFKNYSMSNNIFKVSNEESLLRNYIMLLTNNVSNIDEVIKDNSMIIKEILVEDDIETTNDVIKVNNEDIKVRCISINLDNNLIDRYLDELYKNEGLLKDMALIFDKDVNEFKEYISNKLHNYDDRVKFNLFVKDKYKIVGFDYELDGFTKAYLYNYNDSYEINFDIDKLVSKVLNIVNAKVNKDTNVNFVVNDSNVDLTVNTQDKYTLLVKDNEIIYSNVDVTKNFVLKYSKDNIYVSYKNNENYFNISIDIKDGMSDTLLIEDNKLVVGTSKINQEKNKFNRNLNTKEKDVYEYIEEILYN